MPQGYIKEATYKFSDLYLPGKLGGGDKQNVTDRRTDRRTDGQTDRQTDGSFIYIDVVIELV